MKSTAIPAKPSAFISVASRSVAASVVRSCHRRLSVRRERISGTGCWNRRGPSLVERSVSSRGTVIAPRQGEVGTPGHSPSCSSNQHRAGDRRSPGCRTRTRRRRSRARSRAREGRGGTILREPNAIEVADEILAARPPDGAPLPTSRREPIAARRRLSSTFHGQRNKVRALQMPVVEPAGPKSLKCAQCFRFGEE